MMSMKTLQKKNYIKRATKLTDLVNKKLKTNYKPTELFPVPKDIGWRYCKKCDYYYKNCNYCPYCGQKIN